MEPTPDLSGRILLSVQDGFQLNPELVSTDVEEFERLVSERNSGSLQKASELYRGPLLPGLADSWITLEQIRLEDLYLFALAELGDNQEAAVAIGALRSGLKLDPTNPKWHVRLIQRYLELAQPNRAKDQLEELRTAMEGEEPDLLAELSAQIEAARKPTDSVAQPRRVILPEVANRFFGRESELETVSGLLLSGSSRLITLQGPAGVGKTRTSLEAGKLIAERSDWNVIFVPLADRSNAAEILEAMLGSLQTNQPVSEPGVQDIINVTKGRQTLFILDNLEQIAELAGPQVARLLGAGPNLSFLCTSRVPLQISAEQILTVSPLPVPGENWRASEPLDSFASVQLFLDRCRAIRPDTRLDRRNAEVIADLCMRFDGLPLALEIAAGLSASFSLRQMANHLPDRQTEILNRRRDSPARHRSLKAAIDWGFLWLDPELCQLFLKLSVFRGSFGLEAAKAICMDGDGSIVNAITALVDCSLVRHHPSEDDATPRFSLLVAFREYAEHRLSANEMDLLRQSHATYFAGHSPPDRPFRNVEEQTAVHMEIEADYQNFLAAISFSIQVENISQAAELLAILATRWLTQGPKVAERELIQCLVNHPKSASLEPGQHVQMLRMMGTTNIRSGRYQAAYEYCNAALQIAQASDNLELVATCYSGLSVCAGYLGNMKECAELNRKVLNLVGNTSPALAERSHLGLGSVYSELGRFEEANAEFEIARKISERLRGGEPDALIVVNQAHACLGLGQLDQAARFAHEAIRISNRLRDEFTLAMALTVLSKSQIERGALEAAAATNLEALARFRKGNFAFWILRSLRNHALILVQLKRLAEATTLLSLTSELEARPDNANFANEDQALGAVRSAMTSESFEAAWARGLTIPVEEAVANLLPTLAA